MKGRIAMEAKSSLAAATEQSETAKFLVGDLASIALSIRALAIRALEDDSGHCLEGIKALAEKAGYIADKTSKILGAGVGVCGDYDEWTGLADRERELKEMAAQ